MRLPYLLGSGTRLQFCQLRVRCGDGGVGSLNGGFGVVKRLLRRGAVGKELRGPIVPALGVCALGGRLFQSGPRSVDLFLARPFVD